MYSAENLPWVFKYRVRRDAATSMYISPLIADKDRFRRVATEFALTIYKNLGAPLDQNVVVAPSLAALPLVAALAIADGDTRTEIKKALGVEDWDDDFVHSQFQYAFYRLNQNGRRHDQWRPHGIKLWDLHPVYLLLMKKTLLPTGDKWNEKRARTFRGYENVLHCVRVLTEFNEMELKNLDQFLSQETKKDFSESFPQGTVQPPTNMAMMSAMSFNGVFVNGHRVDEERDEVFQTDGRMTLCKFICNETLKEYAEDKDCKVLGLEYCWGSLTLYIFLPQDGYDLEDLEDELTAQKVTQLLKLAATHRIHKNYIVKYEVPAFRIRQSHDLTKTFRERFGLTSLFDDALINLKTFQATEELEAAKAMGPVRQHACITVTKDMRGELNRFARPLREAVTLPSGGERVEFIANRPFFYLVYDYRAQIFLFMGRVADPTDTGDEETAPPGP